MVSKKEPKPRIANAFQAMKALGISEDKVKPVLKKLLNLYDKNWELIEEENYRVLADAIFESDDAEAAEPPKKKVNNEAAEFSMMIVYGEGGEMDEDALETEEFERPLKRLRRKHQDGQNSSSQTSNTGMASPELNAENTRVESQIEKNDQNIALRTECRSPLHSMSRSRRKGSVSPQIPHNRRRSVPESSSHVVRFKEPNSVRTPVQKNNATPALKKPKDEPITDDMLLLENPVAVIHPDASKASERGTTNPNERRTNGMPMKSSNECCSKLEIASSPSGEVKMSLSFDLSLQRPDFQMPTLEAVLKSAEDKCIKSYKIVDPNFSLKDVMKEMCQCFLELVSKSNRSSPTTTGVTPTGEFTETIEVTPTSAPMETIDVTPSSEPVETVDSTPASELAESLDMTLAIDLMNRSSAAEALCARGLFSSVNRLVDPQSNAQVPLIAPPSPQCNGIDDGLELHKIGSGDESGSGREEQENSAERTNGLSLVVVQQAQVTTEIIRPGHDVDITKGQENDVILLVNGVNDESPPSFYYIPQNAVFQKANVNFSLACIGDIHCCSTCFGDCLSLASPCACATRGEFAYTMDGLVKEAFLAECISMKCDPKKHHLFFCKECPLEISKSVDNIGSCKGHLLKKFIKECWLKCGCNKQCGNRVVQRGISRSLQVFMTPEGKGWGLRTMKDLPKGAFVCEYAGEILTTTELYDRGLRSPEGEKYSYPVLLDADWSVEGVLKDEDALGLDATHYGNVARFINHRCYDSNLVEIPVQMETPDRHYYHVALFTTRNVEAMEELTWDYGIDFDDKDRPTKAFRCLCESNLCRNK